MTDRTSRKPRVYSLRTRMLFAVLLGAAIAAIIYFVLRISILTVINRCYTTAEARSGREDYYVERLQDYIDAGKLSSDDNAALRSWALRNRYVYLMLYKDDVLLFSSDDIEDEEGGIVLPPGGGTALPDREELIAYAEENNLYQLTMSDGILLAAVADFSEYFYYDVATIVSIAAGLLALLIVVMIYIHDVTRRISRLAADVTLVSDGDMNHEIGVAGKDEIATLSENVEQMRSSMLENIQKEHEALDSNAELITSMSHDIRTPLTVLLGYLDIMKMRAEGDETMTNYIRASETTAMRLKSLSDDMFRYFLVFSGKEIKVDLADYDAETLIEQMTAEHLLLLQENGYRVKIKDDSQGMPAAILRTDAPKLMRIIDNIFSNLYKYADPASEILFYLSVSESEVSLRVENKINRTGPKAESTGIGLRTCKKIADAIGVAFTTSEGRENFSALLSIPMKHSLTKESEA